MGFDPRCRLQDQFSSKGHLLMNHAKLKGNGAAKSTAAQLEAKSNVAENCLPITLWSLFVLNHLLKEEQLTVIMYEVVKCAEQSR
jgi:hypothetical protein